MSQTQPISLERSALLRLLRHEAPEFAIGQSSVCPRGQVGLTPGITLTTERRRVTGKS